MSTQPTATNNNTVHIIEVFAKTQLALINRDTLADSTFLTLATCAFFHGAENQLRKQGQISPDSGKAQLVALLARTCRLSERTAVGIVNSVERLADKYYLIENIIQQGKQCADVWLSCETNQKPTLVELVEKYRDLSMFDLGIEGINAEHEEQQQQFYSSIDQSVGKLRQRVLIWTASLTCIGLTATAVYVFLT
jgi:hypothetical protein